MIERLFKNPADTRRAWYDHRLKLWTLQVWDPTRFGGVQVGEVDYVIQRQVAMDWIGGADLFVALLAAQVANPEA